MVTFQVVSENGQNVTIPADILAAILNFVANAGTGTDGDVDGSLIFREVSDRGKLRREVIVKKGASIGTYLWYVD